MKIRISGRERNICLLLPTSLIFSGATIRLMNIAVKFIPEDVRDYIPSDKLEMIFRELRRIRKKHGSFDLVDVESADGEKIKITL